MASAIVDTYRVPKAICGCSTDEQVGRAGATRKKDANHGIKNQGFFLAQVGANICHDGNTCWKGG